MKQLVFLLISALILLSCKQKIEKQVPEQAINQITIAQINQNIEAGDFKKAETLINQVLSFDTLSSSEKLALDFKKDWMNRIRLDFSKSEDEILIEIKKILPETTSEIMRSWEAAKTLEVRIIDGERRYFKLAANNLFRLDANAKAAKRKVAGSSRDPLALFLDDNIPSVINLAKSKGKIEANSVGFKLKYTLTVKPNVVPKGEIIRCWLPFPRDDNHRQIESKLISVNSDNYIISPGIFKHRSLYLEKKAEKDKPTEFSMEVSFRGIAEWYNIDAEKVKPYLENEFFREFTAERPPQIVFSEQIKQISKQVVGNETNPYLKAKKIFRWIANNYPWASALEYSTMPCIPAYVLENKHGDCGMVTLLFMNMARYNGIPCKWQSGWMLHPNSVNLHDWCEAYFEGIGWVPVDQSFGLLSSKDENVKFFYTNGMDSYRFIVNDDFSADFYPAKLFPRSETIDFQRGEVEWRGGNIYFDKWNYNMEVEYLK